MKNVKLYIDKQIVELDGSLSIALTKQIADYQDISKRTGDFSYTIKIPITSKNRKIFKFIDDLNITNRFVKAKNYEAQLYADDNLLIEGYFILREITKKNFEGNITNKFSDVFAKIGEKSLRDLNLPKIDFEGLLYPYGTPRDSRSVNSLSSNCLNPDLGFDLLSLSNAYKNPEFGLYGSEVDYTDYYSTSLVGYSNFPADSDSGSNGKNINTLNVIINSFSLDNFMPQIRLTKVLEQIFTDINFRSSISNSILSDPNVLIPYFGSESPWNWGHLSKLIVSSDHTQLETYTQNSNRNYIKPPILSSRATGSDYRNLTFNWTNQKQFTDQNVNKVSEPINDVDFVAASSADGNYKAHYMFTNKLDLDPVNNFDFFTIPIATDVNRRDLGWKYIVPVDGEYEFELDIDHDITSSQSANSVQGASYNNDLTDTDGEKLLYGNTITGYDGTAGTSWRYNSYEPFLTGNFVAFIKDNDIESLLDSYAGEFNVEEVSNKLNYVNYIYPHKIRNWFDTNVIAYYSPMLRDLYHGNFDTQQKWRDYIVSENSILKNSNPIPTDYTDENDYLKYFGFSEDTQILDYQNFICYDPDEITTYWSGTNAIGNYQNLELYNDKYSISDQLNRKLVRLKHKYIVDASNRSYNANIATDLNCVYSTSGTVPLTIYRAKADGNVKFKFKTKLKAGEVIRMYYLTANQFGMTYSINNHTFPPAYVVNNWDDNQIYNDNFADEYNINSLKITCTSSDTQLNLAKFLPDIKQKDFLIDFIKSNNLYYNLDGNSIEFFSKADFFKYDSQKDLTGQVSVEDISITPIDKNYKIEYGLKPSDNYDFKDFVEPTGNVLDDTINIYQTQEILDLTSKVFYSTFDRSVSFREYEILPWDGRFLTSDTNYTSYQTFTIPSFSEDGDYKVPLDESTFNMDRNPHLIYGSDTKVVSGNATSGIVNMLVNNIPYSYLNFNQSYGNVSWLSNTNRTQFFSDTLTKLVDVSLVEMYVNLTDLDYSNLKLNRPVKIDGTLYFIQKIQNYNPLSKQLTKVLFLKI